MAYSRTTNDHDDLFSETSTISFEELMQKVHYTVEKHDKYQFVNSLTRNIILMGRSRTGKSTVAQILQKSDYVPEKRISLFSETKELEFHRIAAPDRKTSTIFNFNVIDTPGLYDKVTHKGEPLSNESITKLIQKCMKQDMTNIHCFAFVFNLHNGINVEDIQSMIYVKDNFPGVGNHMVLLVTNCEETTKDARVSMMENFFKHQQVVQHKLKEFFRAGIYFMGCLRNQLREYPDLHAAGLQMKNILEMRQTFLDYLIAKDVVFNIHQSPDPRNPTQSSGICRTS